MIDFALLPPEINSLKMYTGAGAGPLVAAAASWSQIANGLSDAATQHVSTVTGLAAVWTGPSAEAMLKSSLVYTRWLSTTAALAQTTATQAQAAVAAYEIAYAATVPPFEVTENRARLSVLVATNFLGINSAAIAATEAQYAEMWAQDATAMYAYAASSQAATQLTPFEPLKELTTNVPTPSPQGTAGNIQNTLQGLSGFDPTTGWAGLLNSYIQSNLSSGVLFDIPLGIIQSMISVVALESLAQGQRQIDIATAALPPGTVLPEPAPLASVISAGGLVSPTGTAAQAEFGNAQSIGRLSVPQAWGRSIPVVNNVTPLSPGQSFMGMPGSPLLGRQEKSESARYGFRQKKVIPHHPSGG